MKCDADRGPEQRNANPAVPRRAAPQQPAVRRSGALTNPAAMAALQRSAGNAAVGLLLTGQQSSRDNGSAALDQVSSMGPESCDAPEQLSTALNDGRRRAGSPGSTDPDPTLEVQRDNPAAGALLMAKLRSPGREAAADIDSALAEVRRDEPAIDKVEKGLKAAKALGVPVDLERTRPPASALSVTKTGFGPASVPAKKPAPPAKPVPGVSPVGKAGSRTPVPAGPPKVPAAHAPASTRQAEATVGSGGPLGKEALLQPPAPPTGTTPAQDPAFGAVTGHVTAFGKAQKAHPPAPAKAKEAQAAAVPPTDDMGAQAKAAKVDTMDAQPAGTFDKKAFIAAVKAAIEAKSPKTLSEADKYAESGKAGEVKGDVKGLVTAGKDGQAKDIEMPTEAAPDPSKAVAKPVTPMVPEQPGPSATIPAKGAAPKPAPPEQLNLAAGKHQADQELADADVTEPQLAKSNEPEFHQAVADKQAAAAHADTAPGQYRAQEKQTLEQGRAEATAETAAGVTGMHASKGAALAALVAEKGKTKSKDEAKRVEVTGRIQAIFTATETDVRKILDGIDPKVDKAFEEGEAAARKDFESYVAAKMSAYKKDRYGGWLGGLRWAKDKLVGMPDKVNEFYEAGRELYLRKMDGVITRVADIVGADLTAAKQRIAKGKGEIAAYVKSLPADLQKVGTEASNEIGEKFQQLESDVDAKQEAVVDSLATKYVEARKGLDERIEALQAENKGLVDKAIGAIKAVINTIRQLVAMLKNVLSRVAGVVGDIIKDPIGFLGNLIAGVKGGIEKFKDNILDHLRKGLMSWLFGALAEGGIEIPDKLDVKGIIKLLASLFGLTWANIRNRLVKQIGEKAMAAAEKGVEVFKIIATEGVGGLWQMLLEKLGDIKEMILEQVKDFVITKIITAGITWLIGLLNPAAAFIKACKLIYDVVMFFVTNAARIATFVNTVIDSVTDIVRGNVSGVVNKINNVLGQMVPIIIGFLASVIGLGGIGQKIREIVQKLQKPINKALDFVIKTGLKLAGPIIRGLKGISGKVKTKVAAGKAWVKGKVLGGDDSPAGKQKRLDKGLAAGVSAANKFAGKTVGDRMLKPLLSVVRVRYGLQELEPVKQGNTWAVHGVVSRIVNPAPTRAIAGEGIDHAGLRRLVTRMVRELLAQPEIRRRYKEMRRRLAESQGGLEIRSGEEFAGGSAAQRRAGSAMQPFRERTHSVGSGDAPVEVTELKMPGKTNAIVRGVDAYPSIAADLANSGLRDKKIAREMQVFIRTGEYSSTVTVGQRDLLGKLSYLMIVREGARNPRNLAHVAMTLDLISQGKWTWHKALAEHETPTYKGRGAYPMSMVGAAGAARGLNAEDQGLPAAGGRKEIERRDLEMREYGILEEWVMMKLDTKKDLASQTEKSISGLVRPLLLDFFGSR